MKWIGGFLLFVLLSAGADAQEASRPQKVDDLVRLLQDPDVRSWLEKSPATDSPTMEPSAGLAEWEASARLRIDGILQAIPRIPDEVIAAGSRTRTDALSHGRLPVFIVFIGLTAIGLFAERLFNRSRQRRADGLQERMLAIGVFTAAMAAVFFALDWPPLARIVLLVALLSLVAYRTLGVVLDAAKLTTSVRRRMKVFVAATLIAISCDALGKPLSVDPFVTQAISYCFSVVLLVLGFEAIASSSDLSVRKRIALLLALIAVWVLWCVGLRGLFWVCVYAMALPSMLRFIGQAASISFPYEPHSIKHVLLLRGVRAIVIAAAVAWLALVWRLDPNSLVHRDATVAAVSFGILKSVVVVLLADLAWHLAKAWIDGRLSLPSDGITDASQAARQARLRTLLPIFRNVLAVVVAVVAGLIVLAEIGVEIGPLIAGAGIFGVALGFGSQTLVKDVIAGVFYMLDDAFRVGEYIQAKSYKGTVEGFSLRSVRLRHHRGPVYTVPFGELGAVENMSRDWGVVKFRISVSHDADLEKARKVTKKIGAALMEDPELGPIFIEPLKMKGLEEFGDYGVVLSFGMMLHPSPLQSMIRRRANLMIREAFKENGIEFATPSVQVGNDDRDTAAAAVTAIRNQQAKAIAAEG